MLVRVEDRSPTLCCQFHICQFAGFHICACCRSAERSAHTSDGSRCGDVEKFAEIYLKRVAELRERNKSWKNDKYQFAPIVKFRCNIDLLERAARQTP